MRTRQSQLIDALAALTGECKSQASIWTEHPTDILNAKPHETGWSALECLEHLNRYGDFYLPEIERRIREAKPQQDPTAMFKSGLLGQFSVRSVLASNRKAMKSPADMNPAGSNLDRDVLDRFIRQQETMIQLLDKARAVDLQKTKTAISLSPLLKLRLGDTLRFVIHHNERHVLQAQRAIQQAHAPAVPFGTA